MTENNIDYSLHERRVRRELARYLEIRRHSFVTEVVGTTSCLPPAVIEEVIAVWLDDRLIYSR